MKYKLYIAGFETTPNAATTIDSEPQVSFLFHADNTDYQQFKKDIASGVQLTDANNNVMTSEQANTFLATIP